MKDAAVAGAATAVGSVPASDAGAGTAYPDCDADTGERCPYFDQPLFCGGKKMDGRLQCEE